MHTQVRRLLESVTGVSEFVISVNIDIRGFSSFSMMVDSSETAIFIQKVYKKIIDDYFPSAKFVKPTGDGLLIILPYKEEDLKEMVGKIVQACMTLIGDFAAFCEHDPMINFNVPKKIGIGLSRGAVCRIASKDKTLDYSGRVINLSSRLMNLARPEGIVIDGNLGSNFFPKSSSVHSQRKQFISQALQKGSLFISTIPWARP